MATFVGLCPILEDVIRIGLLESYSTIETDRAKRSTLLCWNSLAGTKCQWILIIHKVLEGLKLLRQQEVEERIVKNQHHGRFM